MAYPDYDTILAIIADELHEPSDDIFVGRYMSQALAHFRGEKFVFTDKDTSVTLVAAQNEYALDGTVFPGDLLSIYNITRLEAGGGTLGNRVRPIGIDEFRMLESSGSATSGQPDVYCIFDQAIWLWPTPGSAYVCNVDYHIDSTKDTATGNTTDPDAATHLGTHTNDFFARGRELLKARTIYNYAAMRSHDDTMIQRGLAMYGEAMDSLKGERDILKITGRKAKSYWGSW